MRFGKIFSKYEIKARFFPTILNLIPLFILQYYFTNNPLFLDKVLELKIIGNISISLILIYLLSQFFRVIGKDLFEKRLFKNELDFPTTKFLLFSNTQYSKEYKLKIHKKIKKDFSINLLKSKEERKNKKKAKKLINEAISQIRMKMKSGTLILQHNIEYGCIRNLIGGSIFGLFASFIITYFNYLYISISLVYGLILILNKKILNSYAEKYAKILIQEYMGESK